jgi:signal transduction histidine kinase
MLQRAGKLNTSAALNEELREVREIVQSTLEKVRALSQELHPVVLDEAGIESALDTYLPIFEKRTGIQVAYEKAGESRTVDQHVAIHMYRVLQEALNNVARHSHGRHAGVRLKFLSESVVLEVEDDGIGFQRSDGNQGMGLISMRERAEIVNGRIEFLDRGGGGALIRLTVPVSAEETHERA